MEWTCNGLAASGEAAQVSVLKKPTWLVLGLRSVLWLQVSMSQRPSWKQMARDLKKHSSDPWGQTKLSPVPTQGSLSGLYHSSTSVGPSGWSVLF